MASLLLFKVLARFCGDMSLLFVGTGVGRPLPKLEGPGLEKTCSLRSDSPRPCLVFRRYTLWLALTTRL